jgi:hypothetical protein
LEGMVETLLFEGLQRNMEKFEQPREFTMIQTLLGLGRRDRPLRSARQFSFFGAEGKEMSSTATACKLKAIFRWLQTLEEIGDVP